MVDTNCIETRQTERSVLLPFETFSGFKEKSRHGQ